MEKPSIFFFQSEAILSLCLSLILWAVTLLFIFFLTKSLLSGDPIPSAAPLGRAAALFLPAFGPVV